MGQARAQLSSLGIAEKPSGVKFGEKERKPLLIHRPLSANDAGWINLKILLPVRISWSAKS